MAKILKPRPKDTVNGFEPVEHNGMCPLNRGAVAIAYKAVGRDGRPVFLKQYRDPVESDDWYRPYLRFENAKRERIENSAAKNFCVGFVDFFESDEVGHPTYYQAFEFIENGADLKDVLKELGESSAPATWKQRVLIAKVMCSAIKSLHDIGIVHCDLKPENVQLIEAPDITAGYKTKLIDMDRSIIVGQDAPWHGYDGYTGTPNYHSPEHLTGKVPEPASDVFTCGLILYELLCDTHPYRCDSDEEYLERIKADSPPRPRLLLSFGSPSATQAVEQLMQRCLAFNPNNRPTMAEIAETLRTAGSGPVPSGPLRPPSLPGTSSPPPEPAPPKPPAEGRSVDHRRLVLRGEDGRELKCNIRTAFTPSLAKKLSEDARFVKDPQFHLDLDDGEWFIRPSLPEKNATLVNGVHLTDTRRLEAGDVVAVGRADGSVVKIPMTVSFED